MLSGSFRQELLVHEDFLLSDMNAWHLAIEECAPSGKTLQTPTKNSEECLN